MDSNKFTRNGNAEQGLRIFEADASAGFSEMNMRGVKMPV